MTHCAINIKSSLICIDSNTDNALSQLSDEGASLGINFAPHCKVIVSFNFLTYQATICEFNFQIITATDKTYRNKVFK